MEHQISNALIIFLTNHLKVKQNAKCGAVTWGVTRRWGGCSCSPLACSGQLELLAAAWLQKPLSSKWSARDNSR